MKQDSNKVLLQDAMKIVRKRSWIFLISLTLVVLYNLKSSGDSMHISGSETCSAPNGKVACDYIRERCDTKYYYIAAKYYCSSHNGSSSFLVATVLVLSSIFVLMLFVMSLLVSNYFFPNLHKTTSVLKINNRVLSFILVPMSNALPDLINFFITLNSKSTNLVLGQLVGYNLIIFTVAIGTISILKPFNMSRSKSMLFDFGWVLVVLVVFLVILIDGRLTFRESVTMIGIYGLYLVYLIFFDKEIEEGITESMDFIEDTIVHEEDVLSPSTSRKPLTTSLSADNSRDVDDISIPVIRHISDAINHVLRTIVPISWGDHSDDLEDITRYMNQGRYMGLWYCCEIPLLLKYQFRYIPWYLVGILPILIVSLFYFTGISVKLKRLVVAFAGITVSLLLISRVSIEILNILKNLGMILNISDYLLGMMVFSVSNSINDLITNITISVKVNPIFGISSCLGSPLLVVLLGIGVNGSYLIWAKGEDLTFDLNNRIIITAAGLILVVSFYLVYLPLNNWNIDRKLGIIVISWYILISVLNCIIS